MIYIKKLIPMSLVSVFIISGCVSPQMVKTNQFGDGDMTCNQIFNQVSQLNRMEADINNESGVSAKNAGMFLVFWPGIILNERKASDALDLINERQSVLAVIAEEKNCSFAG